MKKQKPKQLSLKEKRNQKDQMATVVRDALDRTVVVLALLTIQGREKAHGQIEQLLGGDVDAFPEALEDGTPAANRLAAAIESIAICVSQQEIDTPGELGEGTVFFVPPSGPYQREEVHATVCGSNVTTWMAALEEARVRGTDVIRVVAANGVLEWDDVMYSMNGNSVVRRCSLSLSFSSSLLNFCN